MIEKIILDMVDHKIGELYPFIRTGFLPLKVTAIKYHVCESFLYKLKKQNKLRFYKIGNTVCIKNSELEKLFKPI